MPGLRGLGQSGRGDARTGDAHRPPDRLIRQIYLVRLQLRLLRLRVRRSVRLHVRASALHLVEYPAMTVAVNVGRFLPIVEKRSTRKGLTFRRSCTETLPKNRRGRFLFCRALALGSPESRREFVCGR